MELTAYQQLALIDYVGEDVMEEHIDYAIDMRFKGYSTDQTHEMIRQKSWSECADAFSEFEEDECEEELRYYAHDFYSELVLNKMNKFITIGE